MKEKKDKKVGGKAQNSSLKAVAASAILAGSLLVTPPASAGAADNTRTGTIRERVKAVKTLLKEKLADADAASKLSYSELELSQWGNWGNWGNWVNWNDWRNWNNWNNWQNWGNWGNWRNW